MADLKNVSDLKQKQTKVQEETTQILLKNLNEELNDKLPKIILSVSKQNGEEVPEYSEYVCAHLKGEITRSINHWLTQIAQNIQEINKLPQNEKE